jgi:site-specific DNA-methyltransferase (adenine-specific)
MRPESISRDDTLASFFCASGDTGKDSMHGAKISASLSGGDASILPQSMRSIRLFSPEPLALNDSTVIEGDVHFALSRLPNDSIQCVVTSPPYWGLRDYGIPGQIGLEPTLSGFIQALTSVFAEVKRVLKPDGILWLNIGDGYTSGNRGWRAPDKKNPNRAMSVRPENPPGLKDKDLMGIPWRLAFALQDSGWYLRSDIVWNKPNAMPESVKDRPTRSHEYIFMFTKSQNYRYNSEAVQEPAAAGHSRNRRSVWNINTNNSGSSHIAAFPQALVEPCLLASTEPGDFVLDPFFGSGTVGLVCNRLLRRYVGIELNSAYVAEASAFLGNGRSNTPVTSPRCRNLNYEIAPTLLESPGKYGNGTGDISENLPSAGTCADDPATRPRHSKQGARKVRAKK